MYELTKIQIGTYETKNERILDRLEILESS